MKKSYFLYTPFLHLLSIKTIKSDASGTYYATMLETRPVASDFNATQNITKKLQEIPET